MPVLSAVRTPCEGPSTPLVEPEMRSSLPLALSPTRANCTCDLPETLPLLSMLTTCNWAFAPRGTTTLPSLVTGVTTVAGSTWPTVALSELKSVSSRTTTEMPIDTDGEDFGCGEAVPWSWLTPMSVAIWPDGVLEPDPPLGTDGVFWAGVFCAGVFWPFCPFGAGG